MPVDPRILEELLSKQMLKYIKIIIRHEPLHYISGMKEYFNIGNKSLKFTALIQEMRKLYD